MGFLDKLSKIQEILTADNKLFGKENEGKSENDDAEETGRETEIETDSSVENSKESETASERKAKKALLAKIISSVAEHAEENEVAGEQASLTADSTSTEDGLFSKELDELINAAVEGGELTAKKREIVMRRAAKEGADPDEVEMILEARLFEQQNK